MRTRRVLTAASLALAAAGGAVACSSLLGIQGASPRPGVTQLSAGAAFACALVSDGTVWCWGADDHQQLGHLALDADVPCTWASSDGGTNVGLCNPTPTQVAGLSGVTQLAVGSDFACALLSDGRVDCWGNNDEGQLGPLDAGEFSYAYCPKAFFEAGTAPLATQCTPVPKVVPGIPNATAISAGSVHACAATAEGVYCWGNGTMNLLDNPATGSGPYRANDVPRTAKALVSPLSDPPGPSVDNTCALVGPDNTVCWGPNTENDDGCASGQVCSLSTSKVESVHLGEYFGCTLDSSGSLQCWGYNGDYDIGSSGGGGVSKTPTPSDYVQVLGETDNATIAMLDGRSTHLLAVDPGGRLWGWGDNSFGQLGAAPSTNATACNLNHSTCVNVPVAVNLGDGGAVSSVATGVGFSLAVTSDGTVWAWGANAEGQLGHVGDGGPCVSLEAGATPCDWTPSRIPVPP